MPIVLTLVAALFVATYIVGPIVDPDLWWHLAAGRWIIAHRALPQQDYWNMFGFGKAWQAYSYLPEIVFSWVDSNFGINGLFYLQLLSALILGASLFYVLIKLSQDWFMGGLLAAYATLSTYSHFALRPQTYTWIIFAWMLFFAFETLRDGFSEKRNWALFGLAVLWANVHLTTILGLIAVALVLADSKLGAKPSRFTLFLIFIGSLITPYWGGEWLTLFDKVGHPFKYDFISEFRPITIFDYSAAFLILELVLLGYFLHLKPKSISPGQKVMIVGFSVVSFAIMKFVPYATIALAFSLADFWRRESNNLAQDNLVIAFSKFKQLLQSVPARGFAFLISCFCIVNIHRAASVPLAISEFPIEAVNFIKEHKLPAPLLNTFNDGGYLIYKFSDSSGELSPEWRVSVDGRTNVTPPEIFQMHLDSLIANFNWRAYIDKIKPETILWRTQSPLTSVLRENRDWCQVFQSGSAAQGYVIFVKHQFYQEHKDGLQSLDCTD